MTTLSNRMKCAYHLHSLWFLSEDWDEVQNGMQVMQVEGGRKHWKIRFYGIYIGISQLGLRCKIPFAFLFDELHFNNFSAETPGGGRVLGLSFAGYVPLVSRSPYPIPGALPYSCCCLAHYRPHLSHFWANVIFAIPTYSLSFYVFTLSIL